VVIIGKTNYLHKPLTLIIVPVPTVPDWRARGIPLLYKKSKNGRASHALLRSTRLPTIFCHAHAASWKWRSWFYTNTYSLPFPFHFCSCDCESPPLDSIDQTCPSLVRLHGLSLSFLKFSSKLVRLCLEFSEEWPWHNL